MFNFRMISCSVDSINLIHVTYLFYSFTLEISSSSTTNTKFFEIWTTILIDGVGAIIILFSKNVQEKRMK